MLSAWFSELSTFKQLTLDMGVFIRSMGSTNYKDIKIAMEEVHFHHLFVGILGMWMTFKKAEMEKPLGMG